MSRRPARQPLRGSPPRPIKRLGRSGDWPGPAAPSRGIAGRWDRLSRKTTMSEIDDGHADCEMEAFLDGLEHYREAMSHEIDHGCDWSEAERAEIEESIRW